jgi:hypothetical protein
MAAANGTPTGANQRATTPPFPENGPGLRPKFDGVELVLLDHATPPEMLLEHMERLGNESGRPLPVKWMEMTPELEKLLSMESICSWDFDLLKLNEVVVRCCP